MTASLAPMIAPFLVKLALSVIEGSHVRFPGSRQGQAVLAAGWVTAPPTIIMRCCHFACLLYEVIRKDRIQIILHRGFSMPQDVNHLKFLLQ